MIPNEDFVPVDSPYSWSNASGTPLEDFLVKYRPSMVQNDGTKPWIWVRRPAAEPIDKLRQERSEQEAVKEASIILDEVTEKVESIKNDPSIPLRSSKKTGTKSKKDVREQAQAEATEKLAGIAVKHGYVSGKWLIFAPSDKIDKIWTSVATSLVSGPLSSTSAYSAKAATSPEQETSNYQHVICIYLPDIYNQDKVTQVMRILLRNHGLNLSGAKSNLYTALGIDSKHPSGIPSTTWKVAALMTEKEIKELKDAFFSDLVIAPSKHKQAPDNPPPACELEEVDREDKKSNGGLQAKTKRPKLKTTKVIEDPFASDDDNDEVEEAKRKLALQASKATSGSKKRRQDDDDDDDDERLAKRKANNF